MVSIPFKRESIYALTLFSTPTTLDSGTPNPNTNCAGLFFTQKLERKSPKPLQTLTQTRFLSKNTPECRHRIGLWAISSSNSAQGRIAFVSRY